MRKKENRNDIYWERLSVRLVQERNTKGWTQQELAEKADVYREKINYAELNITGRTLQINEIARISKALDISMDYLVGLTDSKDITSYNGLSDEANEVISNLDKSSLEMFGMIAEQFSNNEVLQDWKIYRIVTKIISQLNSNLLESTETKVMNKDRIPNPDVQKFAFIYTYIQQLKNQSIGFPQYVKVLWEEYGTKIQSAIEQCGNVLNYNKDRTVKINFNQIKDIVEPLAKFKDYVRYNLDNSIKLSIDNITDQDIKDDNSYNKLKQYSNDISRAINLKKLKDKKKLK